MNKIEPIGIGGLHRGLSIPEIYIENTKLHDEIIKLIKENQQLKKQKDDVVEYIKENEKEYGSLLDNEKIILRMLGEIDD